MTWWQGVILGVVQGLTEFLPISSSGHLVVTEAAFRLQTPGVLVEVTVHVATLLAVVVVYRGTLFSLVTGMLRRESEALRYGALLVVATVPAVIAGLWLKEFFERTFDSLWIVGVDFLITGFILRSTRHRMERATRPSPDLRAAGVIGVAQALAIFPGISRSGTTVSAGIWLGIHPVQAAEFSFLMAIPAIAGAAVLQLPDLPAEIGSIGVGSLSISFVAALVSGVFAIRLLVILLKRQAFHHFAPYCWAIGVLTLLVPLVT